LAGEATSSRILKRKEVPESGELRRIGRTMLTYRGTNLAAKKEAKSSFPSGRKVLPERSMEGVATYHRFSKKRRLSPLLRGWIRDRRGGGNHHRLLSILRGKEHSRDRKNKKKKSDYPGLPPWKKNS